MRGEWRIEVAVFSGKRGGGEEVGESLHKVYIFSKRESAVVYV